MKKKLLLLLVLPLLAACSGSQNYVPKRAYPGPDPKPFDMTINFFLDYSHSTKWGIDEETGKVIDVETPIYSMRWYMLEPLGTCPAEVLTKIDLYAKNQYVDENGNKIEKDTLYPTFLGFSDTSSALDEDLIWNFETDYRQTNIVNLYGIWVAQGGENDEKDYS